VWADRRAAGEALSRLLSGRSDLAGALVLGLPRGGTIVAGPVARALGAEVDACLVRKLGVPDQPELAFGAIASGGIRVFNEEIVDQAGITVQEVATIAACEERELAWRETAYRSGRPPLRPVGRDIVLVDDGLATGATMRAAIRAMRAAGARRIVVAVPVASSRAVRELARDVDEVITLETPRQFVAVGAHYGEFSPPSDDEVRAALRSECP